MRKPTGSRRTGWSRGTFAIAAVASFLALGGAGDARAAGPSPSAAESATVPMNFDVQGSADVRTGIRGRVMIAGTFSGTFDRVTSTFEGGFSLTPTRARITVLGLIPVTAETDWIFTERVTGRWREGVLEMRIAARIRHPRLFAFGNVLIAGGGNCTTRRPSVIELRSSATAPATAPVPDPLAGGTLTTYGQGFAISSLAGCGVLDGLLSAVAAGAGNQATLRLSPSRVG